MRVPEADRLGAEGDGFSLAMRTLDKNANPIGAIATGIAQAALDYAAAYSLKRQTFGKPIAERRRSRSSSPTWPKMSTPRDY